MKTHRVLIALALACGFALNAAASDIAREVKFDIPAQSLLAALYQFSTQAKVQVVTKAADVSGASTRGVQGKLAVSKGLNQLLQGTGFSFEVVDDTTIAIKSVAALKSVDVSAQLQPLPPLRMARLDDAPPLKSNARMGSTSNDPSQAGEGKGVPEMLVKGKRTSNTDIERTEDDVQPYVVFDAETIERSMATNLEQFLKTRLPMNTVAFTNNQDSIGGYGNQSMIDLRGLGTNQTLILVNGRRAPAVSNQTLGGSFGQPDINGIPTSSVERIEVLPSTASGIYGGGATGGVINVILKRNYQGVEAKGRYENAFDTDITQRNIEANAGFSLEGGKTNIMLAASYSDSNTLLVRERNFYQLSRDLLTRNNPTWYLSEFSPPAGYTPNISGQFGSELVLDNGTELGSSITHIPVGYRGIALDGLQPLINNAGSYNMDLPNDLNGGLASLVSNPRVESYSANIRREFGSRVEAFVDLSRYKNVGRTVDGDGFAFGITLAADAPNNPFDSDVDVSFPTIGLSSISTSISQTTQAAAGVVVRLPGEWSVQGDYSWNESRNAYQTGSPLVNDAGTFAVSNGVLDVMRDLNLNPIDFSTYRLQNPNFYNGPSNTILKDASLRIAGPLFSLPGGAVTLSGLVEQRLQTAEATYQTTPSFEDSSVLETYYYPERKQDVESAYLETLVPLISAKNAVPLVHSLQMQLSARRDRYETDTVVLASYLVDEVGDVPAVTITHTTAKVASTDYTVGLRYAPVDGIALRASYGTGFLPAGIHQLTGFGGPSRITVTDPKRNNQRYTNSNSATNPVLVYRGGNPNLSPEQSESVSLGLILTPRMLPGLRLSVDYTQIEKSDEMRSLNEQLTADNEDRLPGRIRRSNPTAQDLAAGFTVGRINYMDLTLLNIATTKIEAYDFQADYLWDTAHGKFSAYVLTTYQPHFRRQLLPTSVVVETAGFAGTSALKNRGNGGITWQRGPWTLGWNAQYYDAYLVYGPDATLASRNAAITNQGSAFIPSQMYHDLLAEYRFGETDGFAGLLSNTEISVGIQNILDEVPPVMASTRLYGNYSYYGDARLRRYSVSLRKAF